MGWTGASSLRVIVADGDASVRQQIRYALDATPDLELIATARDGPEAWSSALELRPDVLVLDDRLPIVDGRSVLTRLRTEAPDIRIVMYVKSSAACRDAVDLGASGCGRKDAPLDILSRRFARQVHGRSRGFHAAGQIFRQGPSSVAE